MIIKKEQLISSKRRNMITNYMWTNLTLGKSHFNFIIIKTTQPTFNAGKFPETVMNFIIYPSSDAISLAVIKKHYLSFQTATMQYYFEIFEKIYIMLKYSIK